MRLTEKIIPQTEGERYFDIPGVSKFHSTVLNALAKAIRDGNKIRIIDGIHGMFMIDVQHHGKDDNFLWFGSYHGELAVALNFIDEEISKVDEILFAFFEGDYGRLRTLLS